MQNTLEIPNTATVAARFAACLRHERTVRGLSARALSLMLAKNATVISRLESGRVLPSLSNVIRLCRVLSCPLSALLPDAPPSTTEDDSAAALPATPRTTTKGSATPPPQLAALLSRPTPGI